MNIHLIAGLFFGFLAGILFTQFFILAGLRGMDRAAEVRVCAPNRQSSLTPAVSVVQPTQIDARRYEALEREHKLLADDYQMMEKLAWELTEQLYGPVRERPQLPVGKSAAFVVQPKRLEVKRVAGNGGAASLLGGVQHD